jgi:hypothetical protein
MCSAVIDFLYIDWFHANRDELLTKILEICSQNDYQYISNFEWYVSVLVELSQVIAKIIKHLTEIWSTSSFSLDPRWRAEPMGESWPTR